MFWLSAWPEDLSHIFSPSSSSVPGSAGRIHYLLVQMTKLKWKLIKLRIPGMCIMLYGRTGSQLSKCETSQCFKKGNCNKRLSSLFLLLLIISLEMVKMFRM